MTISTTAEEYLIPAIGGRSLRRRMTLMPIDLSFELT